MIKTGFDSERLRKKLLERGDRKKLKLTYSSRYPSINDGNNGNFWDKKFQENGEKDHLMARDRNRIISKMITGATKILNLGAGNGYLEEVVSSRGLKKLKWFGTDITKKTLLSLKRRFPKWNFSRERLEKLSFGSNTFDGVLLLEVLEHIKPESTFKVLGEAYRVLKRNGLFILSVPVNEGLEEMYPLNPNQHLRVYSEELVIFELEESGFFIEKIIKLSAFSKLYHIKKFLNMIFKLREPNNLVIIARKK